MKATKLLISALVLAMTFAPASAVEYLINGSFEQPDVPQGPGSFFGWTQSGNLDFTAVVDGPSPDGSIPGPQSGVYYVWAGPADTDGFLSQTFSDNAGELLTVSGWVFGTSEGGASHVNFFFNNVLLGGTADPVDQPWTFYSFSVNATGSDTFSLGFRDDIVYVGLDNFSVTNTVGAVPELSTWMMLLLGFGAINVVWLSRNRKPITGPLPLRAGA